MSLIKSYLKKHKIKQVDFCEQIGVSSPMLYQMIRGIRPVPPKVSLRIEGATKGEITRKQLRPDDWQELWPDLKLKPSNNYSRAEI